MSTHLMCTTCCESFQSHRDTTNCKKCGSEHTIEVDDLIAPTIVELNKKGYETQFCCSGHISGVDRSLTYILFDDAVFTQVDREWFLSTVPSTFRTDRPKSPGYQWDMRIGIDSIKTSGDKLELLFHVATRNGELLKWARSLPALELSQAQREYIRLFREHKLDYKGIIASGKLKDVQVNLQRKVDGAYS